MAPYNRLRSFGFSHPELKFTVMSHGLNLTITVEVIQQELFQVWFESLMIKTPLALTKHHPLGHKKTCHCKKGIDVPTQSLTDSSVMTKHNRQVCMVWLCVENSYFPSFTSHF